MPRYRPQFHPAQMEATSKSIKGKKCNGLAQSACAGASFARMLGVPLSELPGRPLRDFWVEDDWPALDAALGSAPAKRELQLKGAEREIPVLLSVGRLETEGLTALCAVVTDLTEQKRGRDILASEQLARAILDQSPEIVVVLDANGCVLRASNLALSLASEDCGGRGFESVFTLKRDGKGAPLGGMDLLSASGTRERFDATLSTRSEVRIVQVGAAPLINASKEIIGCVLTMADVSERHRMESALHESEQRRALATEAAEIGTWDWDIVRRKMVGDAKLYELFGVEPFSTTVRENFEFIHPEDRDRVWNAQLTAVQKGTEYREEFRVVRPDGSERWLAATGKVLRSPDDRPIRFMGAAQDITARKQAEMELRSAKERLELATEAGRALIFDWDVPAGRVDRFHGESVTGYSAEEAPRARSWWVDRIHPDDRSRTLGVSLESISPEQTESHSEYRIRHKNAQWIWLRERARLIRDRDGSVLRVIGVARRHYRGKAPGGCVPNR